MRSDLSDFQKIENQQFFIVPTHVPCGFPISCGRPGSLEVPRNPLTRWDVSLITANGIFLTKEAKNRNKNDQRVEND